MNSPDLARRGATTTHVLLLPTFGRLLNFYASTNEATEQEQQQLRVEARTTVK